MDRYRDKETHMPLKLSHKSIHVIQPRLRRLFTGLIWRALQKP